MNAVFALLIVVGLAFVAMVSSQHAGSHAFFGIALPYVAVVVFIGGMIYRIVDWARSPVPFRIPTTCGQQKSLDWIKPSRFDNPTDTFGVVVRMALEVLFFRSLFRNTSVVVGEGTVKPAPREEGDESIAPAPDPMPGPVVAYSATKWLWLAGLAFHYAFLFILLRHLRFFTEPVPMFVDLIEGLDGFMEIGLPTLFLTGAVLLLAVTYLLLRRLFLPEVRYISLLQDYFPLFLILGIGISGITLRHFVGADMAAVKELTLSLARFQPVLPEESLHFMFYTHVFLVCVLFIYFPFSKLVHLGGVFFSPTRNLANNSRIVRHVNPWAKPAKLHSYKEYEAEFGEKMKAAGIPLDKD
ncbi:MAG: menaquinol oxidoreductase [Deltaproteobacteria bacterium]|nr:MAG: menaquinol oxidoreductase [Deltaproteobacteria bacterium]